MKKFLIESGIFLICLIMAIIFYKFSLTEGYKVEIKNYDTLKLVKEFAKPVLAITILLWAVSGGVRAFITTLKTSKSSK